MGDVVRCPECGDANLRIGAYLEYEGEIDLRCPNCGVGWRYVLAEKRHTPAREENRPVEDNDYWMEP